MWRPWCDDVSAGGSALELDVGEVNNDTEVNTPQPKLAGRGHPLSKGQQAAVKAMMQYAKDKGAASPVSDTVNVLGVSRNTVYRVMSKQVVSPKKKGKPPGKYMFQRCDDFQRKVIQRTIYQKYSRNEVPTVPQLYQEIREKDPDFNYSERHFHRLLKDIGFKFKKLDRRRRVMLSNRIIILRDQYLFKVQQLRAEGIPLIFLDETWYDTHDVVEKGWSDDTVSSSLDTPPSRGKRIIILHAGCERGWVPGALLIAAKNIKDASADYHQDMNADLFEAWFEKQLLPGINFLFPEQKCATILDNAPYHGRLLHKTPSMKMTKAHIIETLQELQIPIPTTSTGPNNKTRYSTKADLLQVYKDAGVERQFIIDKLAERYGYEVVRLPPYYCIYNPIELVWASLKKDVRRRNTSPVFSAGVIEHIRNVTAEITEDLWRNCCEHARQEERKNLLAPTVDNFIISLQDEEIDDDEDLDLGCAELAV